MKKLIFTLFYLLACPLLAEEPCNIVPIETMKYKTKEELIDSYCFDMKMYQISRDLQQSEDSLGFLNDAIAEGAKNTCIRKEVTNAWLVLRKDFDLTVEPTCK